MLEQIFTKDDTVRDPAVGADSPMRKFFRGKTVFLTGGTGFLGKLFIEKLLRCEVAEVVLLIRAKRDQTPRERLQQQLEREAIYTSYSKNPDFYWKRLRIVEGALEYDRLNLSDSDLDYLQNNVDVVIHSAANVRFGVSLKTIIKTNVFGANELLKVALAMKRLVSFLFISTAYSNCPQPVVEEQYYDMGVDPMLMVRFVDSVDESQLDALCSSIIDPWPNTYTYAKALAENVFLGYCDRLPIAIIRPSIVISTFEDPIEGWTDNLYGLNGAVVGLGCGVLRIMHLYRDYHVDIVPADLVVNSSLAVIWYTSTKQKEQQGKQLNTRDNVFNCTNRKDNPFTFEDFKYYSFKYRSQVPIQQGLWFPTGSYTSSATLYYILQLLYHFLPALFFDAIARLKGQEARVLFLYRKVQQFTGALKFFTTNEWMFANGKMRKVQEAMVPDDKEFFPADIRAVRWHDFYHIYFLGLRKYILKEDMNTIEKAKKKYRLLQIAHYTVLTLYYSLLAYLVFLMLQRSRLIQF